MALPWWRETPEDSPKLGNRPYSIVVRASTGTSTVVYTGSLLLSTKVQQVGRRKYLSPARACGISAVAIAARHCGSQPRCFQTSRA